MPNKLLPMLLLRPGELRQGEWPEINLAAATWAVPAARMKREKAGNEGYRETTMDDLKAAPMPLAQKVVLALAAVGVVAIVAWYLFLR